MESIFNVILIILLVTQVRKTESAIDDFMYEAEEEIKTSMPKALAYAHPAEDESATEESDDFFNYTVNGSVMQFAKYQYDILLQKEQYNELMGNDRYRRNAIKDLDQLWPGGIIPYTIDDFFSEKAEIIIRNAIDMWSDWTCLNFVKATNENNKLHFEHKTEGCGESEVGMKHGTQSIYLSHNCSTNVRVVAHEIGHAIGLYHEQMRHDRDEYVTVHRKNLMTTRTAWNNLNVMKKNQYQDFDKPYDYLSIMHYGKLFFSKNKTANLVTLSPKNESYLDIIGEVQTISYLDVKIVCQLYDCSAKCTSTCSGIGFMGDEDAFMGAECQCMCKGPSDDNPIQHCPRRESCSISTVNYSKYAVWNKSGFKIPKNSRPFDHGSTIEIEWIDKKVCGKDYSEYECQKGEWKGDLPECQPGCVLKTNWKTQYTICDDYNTITVSGGADDIANCTLLDSFEHGDNITLNCKSNLTKMVKSQCNNGSWTTFTLNCSEAEMEPCILAVSADPKYIDCMGGLVAFTDSADSMVRAGLSRVNVTCSEKGRETMGCFFDFYKKCPKLFELAGMNDDKFIPGISYHEVMNKGGLDAFCKSLNVKITNTKCPGIKGFPGRVKYRKKGSSVTFKCPNGFNRYGSRKLICQRNESWNGEPPLCVSKGCVPVDMSDDHNLNMSERYRGALLTFSCDDDYMLIGNKEVYCNGRVWSSEIPQCKAKQPEVTVYVRKTSYITIAGQTVVLECYTDDVTGRVTLFWSRLRVGLPTGSSQNNGLLTIPNVQTSYAGIHVCTGTEKETGREGTAVTILLVNLESISCSVDEFTCAAGECVSISVICDDVPDCSNGMDETNCISAILCNEGMEVCADEGQCFSPSQKCDGESQCQDGSDEQDCNTIKEECPKPALFNYGTVQYDGRSAGSVVRYMCDDGYSIVGENERKCLSTGMWDGEMAVCIKDVPMPKPSCELKITKDGHVIDDGEVAFAVGGKENLVYCDATCTGSGMPPALRWYRYRKDGSRKRLSKFNSTRVYTNRMTFNRISILTISNMLARDTGKYKCRGWLTPQGWVEKAIHLRYSCGRSSFMCDGTLCVNNDRHCDGVSDCRDGTDESTCDICAENEFVCDGRCLSMSFMCDNIPDCDDAADEQNCPSTPNTVTSTTTPTTSNTASITDDYDYNYE